MDEIRIDGLEVYAYHGVFPEENRRGQTFVINAVLYTQTRKAAFSDDLSLSTHYGEVCEFMYQYMKNHTYKMIETVAEHMAREILLAFPNLRGIRLEIKKPDAPIPLSFESVSVRIRRDWHRAYVAFGSNMGDRQMHIEQGLKKLEQEREIKVLRVSDKITTKPYGGVEQEDFLNGVVELDTLLTPEELLHVLHEIEQSQGRERTLRWGPRTLDLDIIFYDKEIMENDVLIIPHVDMQNRDFVLKPLLQLIPNFRHPLYQKTVQQLWQELEAGRQA